LNDRYSRLLVKNRKKGGDVAEETNYPQAAQKNDSFKSNLTQNLMQNETANHNPAIFSSRKSGETVDPRPDLRDDSQLWTDLLINAKTMFPAWINDIPFFGTLHGIRCSGAGLARTTTGGCKLMPGENNEVEWADTKNRWLDPVKDALVKLLQLTALGVAEDGAVMEGSFTEKQSLKDVWLKK